jgi:hypothetical protein
MYSPNERQNQSGSNYVNFVLVAIIIMFIGLITMVLLSSTPLAKSSSILTSPTKFNNNNNNNNNVELELDSQWKGNNKEENSPANRFFSQLFGDWHDWMCDSESEDENSLQNKANQQGTATSGREVKLQKIRHHKASLIFPSAFIAQSKEDSEDKSTMFPSLEETTSSDDDKYPGLVGLSECISASSSSTKVGNVNRVAVMTSIATGPTSAMLGLASLENPWCVLVIGDDKGLFIISIYVSSFCSVIAIDSIFLKFY